MSQEDYRVCIKNRIMCDPVLNKIEKQCVYTCDEVDNRFVILVSKK